MSTKVNHWNYLLAVGLCLFVSVAYPEVPQGTATLPAPLAAPLEKFPAEPAAFLEKVQNLGEKVIKEAEEEMKNTKLSPSELAGTDEKMLWGLKFRYGDDWTVYSEKLHAQCIAYADAANAMDDPEKQFRNLYQPSMSAWADHVRRMAMQENVSREDFEKFCDLSALIHKKYQNPSGNVYDSHYRSVLEYVLIYFVADVLDPDATKGFVQLAAKKLGIDPDAPDNKSRTFDDAVIGTIRRTRLLGKELELTGKDKDDKTVDVKQFHGKPVLIVSDTEISEANQSIAKKLYALLQPEGLVMLKVQQDTAIGGGAFMLGGGLMQTEDRPIKPEEVAAFPGTIVKSKFCDFYCCWSPNFVIGEPYIRPVEEFCLFLLDSQGKVVRLQNSGYDAALCAELKKMFPAKATEITTLLLEIQANQDRWTNEKKKRNVLVQSKNLDPVKKRLVLLYEVIDLGHNDHIFYNESYKNSRSADSKWYRWHKSGLIFPAFQNFPDIPEVSPELRFRIRLTSIKAKQAENAYRVQGDISLQPEIVCKPLNDEIKKWAEGFPKHPFWEYFYSYRMNTINWLMMERLEKLPDAQKKDYAEVVIQELFALAEEMIPANPEDRNIASDFRYALRNTLKEFESIDDSLIEKLKKQFSILIIATSKDEELINFAVKEL
jgi:hypothetical protein